jgi:hypothetical protein
VETNRNKRRDRTYHFAAGGSLVFRTGEDGEAGGGGGEWRSEADRWFNKGAMGGDVNGFWASDARSARDPGDLDRSLC